MNYDSHMPNLDINGVSYAVDQAVANLIDEMQDEIELWRNMNKADPRGDVFVCESCGRGFIESPHATEDGYWLCDPCWQSFQDEVKARWPTK